MEEKTRKVKKTTINGRSSRAVKRGRVHRFAKWTEKNYGVPFVTMYEKLRQNRIKAWEKEGIVRCMDEFGFHGRPGDLWGKCIRNRLCVFMEGKQMSRATVWKRFGADDFTELEMKGIAATYRHWRENVDLKEE